MKRVISFLLAVCLLSSVCAFSVETNALNDSGSCGDGVFWEYDTDTCTLTISGNGEMTDYGYEWYDDSYVTTAPWRAYRRTVKTVLIEDGVASIGDYAFYNCIGLTSANMPDSVKTVGDYAFSGCSNLSSATLPNSVISIGEGAFYCCSSLSSLTIPDSVTSIGYAAFSDCYGITTVTIGNSVTRIAVGTFSFCTKLVSVSIPLSVSNIARVAFFCCDSLTDVYYAGTEKEWKNISITAEGNSCLTNATIHCKFDPENPPPGPDEIIGTFGDNIKWKYNTTTETLTISGKGEMDDNIPNFYDGLYATTAPWRKYHSIIKTLIIEDGITKIGGGTFCGCDGIKNILIPDSVTCIGEEAFSDCTGLVSVTIPDSVKIIDGVAFQKCTSLSTVTIGNSVTTIGYSAFFGCNSLTSITVSDNNMNYSSQDGVLFNKDKTELIQYPAGNSRTEYTVPETVERIYTNAFMNSTELSSVVIPVSITRIVGGVFSGCTGLTDVYYTGTEEEWNGVYIEDYENDSFINATVHFNYDPNAVPGDISGDGKVNVADGLMIKRIIIGTLSSADYMKFADLNGDGKINAVDSVMLKRIILGG
ncbi:MAG: leucine-rich repeat protein [Clostridia bacterium]|nr:leucine-rich repeat protein [Clostridia bacterium]